MKNSLVLDSLYKKNNISNFVTPKTQIMNTQTDYEEISFDPSFMEIGAGGQEKPHEFDFFNEDPLGLKNKPDDQVDGGEENQEKNLENGESPSPKDIKENGFSVVLGQDLVEKGILSSFNEEEVVKIAEKEGDAAAIRYIMEAQLKANDEQIKSAYDAEFQSYLTMVQGGVPKEEAFGIQRLENFAESMKSADLKGESDDSVNARKELLTFHYKLSTNFSDEKIKRIVDKSYDEGTDLDEVDEALAGINNYVVSEKQNAIKQAEQAKLDSQKAQQKWVNDLTKHIESTDEYFVGIKVPKQTKDEIKKLITTPVKLENGEVVSQIWADRAKDPIKWDSAIAYLKLLGFFDGKPLDKFMKVAESKSVSKLDDFLNDNKGRSYMKGMGANLNNSNTSRNSIDAALGLE